MTIKGGKATGPIDDPRVLAIYISEVLHQAEAATIAASQLNRALSSDRGVPEAFAAIQLLLGAGAMLSKLLWAKPNQGKTAVERADQLRTVLDLEASPVLESRKVRNGFEHFDERLDAFLRDGGEIVVDRGIGSRESVILINGEAPKHLRLIDPNAGTVSVLDEKVVIQELYDAIIRAAGQAKTWLDAYYEGPTRTVDN